MRQAADATPLLAHTLDTLCDELLAGRSLVLQDGRTFRLETRDQRCVFSWFYENREKWAQNNRTADCKEMAQRLYTDPAELPPAIGGDTRRAGARLYLKKLRAHRFAGLSLYCSPASPPPLMEHEFSKPFVIVEGNNGAGKTSLLSAVTWCLTGKAYRTQREPEDAARHPVPIAACADGDAEALSASRHTISSVTPVPGADALAMIGDAPVPIDTWVELILADADGNEFPVRRSVSRSARGKIAVTEPDLSSLGIDPIALAVGTLLPAVLPYVQLEATSDLGQAIAELTDLRPLEDLAKHATKAKAKLEKDLPQAEDETIAAARADERRAMERLNDHLASHPGIVPRDWESVRASAGDLHGPALDGLVWGFRGCEADALSSCRQLLDESFVMPDGDAQVDLTRRTTAALDRLRPNSILASKAMGGIVAASELSTDQLEQACAKRDATIGEAEKLARAAALGAGARNRLYARVAKWLQEESKGEQEIARCPVCNSDLSGKSDPVTGQLVADHIKEHLTGDAGLGAQTLTEWRANTVTRLRAEVPAAILAMGKEGAPGDILRDALFDAITADGTLERELAPLKDVARNLCASMAEALPVLDEIQPLDLPEVLIDCAGTLGTLLQQVHRGVAICRWLVTNRQAWEDAMHSVLGLSEGDSESEGAATTSAHELSLRSALRTVESGLANAAPARQAVGLVDQVRQHVNTRDAAEAAKALYERAADAILPLTEIDALIKGQIGSLIRDLAGRMTELKERMYSPAYEDAPSVSEAHVKGQGELSLVSEVLGTRAPAHHVSNTSELRAALLAFLLAFWEHILDSRGGLALFMLDDPQELFDPTNRRKVANALPGLVQAIEGQMLLTTNDHRFCRLTHAAATKAFGDHDMTPLKLLPATAGRPVARLVHSPEAIQRALEHFREAKDDQDEEAAATYADHMRVYMEDMLVDLLAASRIPIPSDATLAALLNAVRTARKRGLLPFATPPFQALTGEPALADGSDFLQLMNDSHHERRHLITYRRVADLLEVSIRCRELVEGCHQQYDLWMQRGVTGVDALPRPDAPEPMALPPWKANCPVIDGLAAFVADRGPVLVWESEEVIPAGFFENKGLYYLNCDHLGFAAPRGSRAIVDLDSDNIDSNRLVVALHGDGAYARRLLRNEDHPDLVVLSSETEDPRRRPQPLFLPASEVRLLKVVGVLFDSSTLVPRPTGEAKAVTSSSLLDEIEVAFNVDGDSALPLLLPRQKVFGGRQLAATELVSYRGRPLAVATEGSEAAVKRLGRQLSRQAEHVWILEPVGARGESMLVRLEAKPDDRFGDIPLARCVRPILGVLYAEEVG